MTSDRLNRNFGPLPNPKPPPGGNDSDEPSWFDTMHPWPSLARRESESPQDWQRRLNPDWNIPAEDLPKGTESWSEYKARVPHLFAPMSTGLDGFVQRILDSPTIEDPDNGEDQRPDHGTLTTKDNPDDGNDDYPWPFGRPIENKPPPGGKFLGVVVPCPEHGGVGCDCDAHDDEREAKRKVDRVMRDSPAPTMAERANVDHGKLLGLDKDPHTSIYGWSPAHVQQVRRWAIVLGFALGVLSTLVAFALIAGWLG